MNAMAVFPTNWIKQFYKSEDGVAVIEFVLSVPLMILLFAIVVEFGRLFIGYQATVNGIRDANRYLARIAPIDICLTGGSFASYNTMLKDRIEKDRNDNNLLPSQFSVTSVTATYSCITGSYRTSPAPVATIAAQVSVQFPLGFLFSIIGDPIGPLTTTISDSGRVFGH